MTSFKNKKNWFKGIFFLTIFVILFNVGLTKELVIKNSDSTISHMEVHITKQAFAAEEDEYADEFTTAGDKDPKFGKISSYIIEGVLQLLNSFSGFVLMIGMSVVDMTMSDKLYDQIFFEGNALTAINTGWGLVRDFVNMFFILILIFVAIATILKINKYSDKKFIVYVISAALFVNFSKPITLFIIDISNLAMSFFMSNIREGNSSYSNALAHSTGMGESLKSETGGSKIGMYISWIVEAIFKFIMGIMLLALGMSLIIRLVALWVLIILSPLAFFALALPGTAIGSIKTTWFNKLTYWCFFGPIMLFFFWLALVLVSAVSVNVGTAGAEMQLAGAQKTGFVIGALKILIPYSACIYMLFYGFDLSKKMAGQAGDGAAWGLGKAGKLAKGAIYAGTAGYGLGYGKAAVDNTKAKFKENREANMLSKRAQLGSKSAKIAHEQNLQREQMKDWDENGVPDEKELKKILTQQPSTRNTVANMVGGKGANTTAQLNAKKRAAAMKLAENGKLGMTGDDDSYAKAHELFKDSPEALNKFEALARKKNRGAMIEHEVKSTSQLAVNKKVADENTRLVSSGGSLMGEAEERAYREAQVVAHKNETYENHLGKMKLADITDQSVDFLKNENVVNYIEKKQRDKDSRFTRSQLADHIAKNTDGDKATALKRFLSSATREDLSEQGERDAMRNMNE